MSELYWDPFDVTTKDDPHPVWSRMRRQAPVFRNQRLDFWALSRFDDVDAAHRDAQTFSSAHGTVLELMSETVLAPGLMIFMDPPDHTYLRRLVSRAFTPRRIAMLETGIRSLCDSLLLRQAGMDRFDFVQDFGARIPAAVIADLLGVPPSDQESVRTLIDQTFHLEPDVGMANEQSIEAMGQLNTYVSGQLAERQVRPREDMFTELIEGEILDDEGGVRRLSLEEATMFALLLASAGTETVARLIGWAGLVLSDHPDQRAELAADPGLISAAVEELLRYEPPSPVQGRWTTRDIEFHGVTIPVNSKVLLLTGSAGRDEHHFTDPDCFDIHRTIDHHVSFGYGIHFCLGAALARMEGRVALEEVLRRYPEWVVDKDNAVALHTSTVRGYSKLPVFI
jgi:cytochrome P450